VRINVAALGDRTRGARLAEDARRHVERARDLARRTADAVESALGD
jgi:hypothetical protein